MKNIVILGPTGAGKTAIAYELACLINGEIISADSKQIYKYLNIGTNKTGFWDENRKVRFIKDIPQYLTDIIEPSETFSAGEFVRLAKETIVNIKKSNKIPIITGGTGLYLKALIDGLVEIPKNNNSIRNDLINAYKSLGIEYLYNELKRFDPISAEKNRYNPQRLIRAIEVFKLTGIPISVWHKRTSPNQEIFLQFGLLWDRKRLYEILDKRSIYMINNGMIEETKYVLSMGFSENCPGLQSIGYKYVIKYLKNEISLSDMQELIKRDTRHYAKRQMTWFNKDKRIKWIKLTDRTFDPKKIAKSIKKLIESNNSIQN